MPLEEFISKFSNLNTDLGSLSRVEFPVGKSQWRERKMKDKKLSYWLPRVLVLSFALSLVSPAFKFVPSLDVGGYIIWLARLTWVISVPVVFFSILLVIAIFRKK